MADFKRRVQSDNRHLENLTSARFIHVDGSDTTPITVHTGECRLLKLVLNTNGATIKLRTGTRVIANVAADAPETTLIYGLYCENGLIVECGGSVDATVIYEP